MSSKEKTCGFLEGISESLANQDLFRNAKPAIDQISEKSAKHQALRHISKIYKKNRST